jgi:plastocyanin
MVKRKISIHIVFTVIIGIIVSTCFMSSTNAGLLTKKTPKINQFSANSASIRVGDKVTLNWSTTGACKVEIIGCDNIVGVLKTSGSKEISPTKTTTYTLNAYAQSGLKISKTQTINVIESKDNTKKVKIMSYSASETNITKGELVSFDWETENAETIKFKSSTGIVSDVTGLKRVSVTPNDTRTYTLVALDAFGNEESKEITIVVGSSIN